VCSFGCIGRRDVATYRVLVEVEGLVTVVVEAESEDEACRLGRHRAERGEGTQNVDYVAVQATQLGTEGGGT
jgi:hypothetical protein